MVTAPSVFSIVKAANGSMGDTIIREHKHIKI
jgi:hypothetical protein